MKRAKEIKDLLPGWLQESAPEEDVVVSSRIRLARNLVQFSFPHQAGEKELEAVIKDVDAVLKKNNFTLKRLEEMGQRARMLLVEEYLVSPDLVKNPSHRGVALNPEQTVAIMLNEEDHLRIQSILPGLRLNDAWAGNQVDDLLEAELEYAFTEKSGYLTTCPTNVGTGLRASVMLHLPALQIVDQVKRVLSVLPQVGLSVRGIYGEGTEALANIYQISNQVTLGLSEEEVIGKIVSVTKQVIEQERSAREALLSADSRLQLEDQVHRAFGLLSQARLLSSEEALKLWNNVLLGVELELISGVSIHQMKELFFLMRPAILQQLVGKDLGPNERDYYRAMVIREHFQAVQG